MINEVDRRDQLGPAALGRIYVPSQSRTQVPLSQIAHLVPVSAPVAVNY